MNASSSGSAASRQRPLGGKVRQPPSVGKPNAGFGQAPSVGTPKAGYGTCFHCQISLSFESAGSSASSPAEAQTPRLGALVEDPWPVEKSAATPAAFPVIAALEVGTLGPRSRTSACGGGAAGGLGTASGIGSVPALGVTGGDGPIAGAAAVTGCGGIIAGAAAASVAACTPAFGVTGSDVPGASAAAAAAPTFASASALASGVIGGGKTMATAEAVADPASDDASTAASGHTATAVRGAGPHNHSGGGSCSGVAVALVPPGISSAATRTRIHDTGTRKLALHLGH